MHRTVMSKLYLGFDAGTQSVKVSVYDENLKSITSQSLPTILRYPHAGWVEIDLDEFLDITVRCIKRYVNDGRDDHNSWECSQNTGGRN